MGITLNWRIGTLCLISYFALICPSAIAAPFKCISTSNCTSVIDYRLPNTTTISAVQSLFSIPSLYSILGANSLPLNTLPNRTFNASSTIKIPFPCSCSNGVGTSNRIPIYTVVPQDGLFHIASDVYSGLVTYPEIQAANNIADANRILVGQKLWIPLPCSCDDVDGRKVVHYGHLVPPGSSVEGIAAEYGTSQDTLLRLNYLTSPAALQAGVIIDVPLRACDTSVESTSLDSPLLVSNGTYAITARDCMQCTCDASRSWTLSCLPSRLNPSTGGPCPALISCPVTGGPSIGLGITITVGCNTTTCAYAGYNNQSILANPALVSTSCPAANGSPNGRSSSSMNSQSWKFTAVFIIVQVLLLLCLGQHIS